MTKKTIYKKIAAIGVVIGIISGSITILDKIYKEDKQVIEQKYYINKIEIIDNKGIYSKK